jgi:putative transposase
MPLYHRHYESGQLQFITTSTYGRAPLLSDRLRRVFVEKLAGLRHEMHFLIVGWVLMPEHFHLLLRPDPAEATPVIMKRLKD